MKPTGLNSEWIALGGIREQPKAPQISRASPKEQTGNSHPSMVWMCQWTPAFASYLRLSITLV